MLLLKPWSQKQKRWDAHALPIKSNVHLVPSISKVITGIDSVWSYSCISFGTTWICSQSGSTKWNFGFL